MQWEIDVPEPWQYGFFFTCQEGMNEIPVQSELHFYRHIYGEDVNSLISFILRCTCRQI